MILKVRNYPEGTIENFIIGEILGITFNSHSQKDSGCPPVGSVGGNGVIRHHYDWDLRNKRDESEYKVIRILMKDGRDLTLAFDTVAWLMNDNGKTIEAIEV